MIFWRDDMLKSRVRFNKRSKKKKRKHEQTNNLITHTVTNEQLLLLLLLYLYLESINTLYKQLIITFPLIL